MPSRIPKACRVRGCRHTTTDPSGYCESHKSEGWKQYKPGQSRHQRGYRQLERAGIVENYELFKQYLVVERDASDPNRLNTLFPPDYVNQLRVFAVVNQFRLQYSEESA